MTLFSTLIENKSCKNLYKSCNYFNLSFLKIKVTKKKNSIQAKSLNANFVGEAYSSRYIYKSMI